MPNIHPTSTQHPPNIHPTFGNMPPWHTGLYATRHAPCDTSAGVTAALKNLPKASKRQKNTQHIENAARFPDDASDAESLVTVSDDEDTLSPASRLYSTIGKLSPASGKALLRVIQSSKRGRDEETPKAPKPISKKARVEITIAPGMALPKAFHQCIHDLHDHHVYIPLSMFTTPSLRTINSEAATMAMCKLNPTESGEKQLRLLDTASFKVNVMKETELDHAEWTEAAENYVEFITLVEGAGSAAESRWHTHFANFTNSGNPKRNFAAIRATDIAMRKDYASQPFAYNREHYRTLLEAEIMEQHISEGLRALSSTGGQQSSAPTSGNSRGGGRGGRGGAGRGGARGGAPAPFQAGSDGDASAVVCLVCARRGHYSSY